MSSQKFAKDYLQSDGASRPRRRFHGALSRASRLVVAVSLTVVLLGTVSVSGVAAQDDPALTTAQLAALAQVTTWNIHYNDTYTIGFSGSGTDGDLGGNYLDEYGTAANWSQSSTETITDQANLVVSGPANCASLAGYCVPASGSGTWSETGNSDVELSGIGSVGCSESGTATYSADGTSPFVNGDGSFYLDESTNPPEATASFFAAAGTVTGTEDYNDTGCLVTASGSTALSPYQSPYASFSTSDCTSSTCSLGAGGDTDVTVVNGQFVVSGTSQTSDSSGFINTTECLSSSFLACDASELVPTTEEGTATWTATAQVPDADLAVTNTAPATALPGDSIDYTIGVTNNGPADAQNVTLTDPLTTETTFVSESQTNGAGFDCATPTAGQPGTVTCTIPTLASGDSATFTVTAEVDVGVPNDTTLTNTATATSDTQDSSTANNSASADTTIGQEADLAVTVTPPLPTPAGGDVTYAITIANEGPGDASTLALSDPLPSQTTFVSESQTSGPAFDCSIPTAGQAGTVSCTLGSLADGGSATFQVVTSLLPSVGVGTMITNTATVSAETPDSNLANNTSSVNSIVAQGSKTVTFNANGGTGTMAPQNDNTPTALTTNTFTRTGYTFVGWNTVAGGTGTAYTNGATYRVQRGRPRSTRSGPPTHPRRSSAEFQRTSPRRRRARTVPSSRTRRRQQATTRTKRSQ